MGVRQAPTQRISISPEDSAGYMRALVGQGLGMGWGDEAEAWLRSKALGTNYDEEVRKIRQGYAEFSRRNPVASTITEFAGGALPTAALMAATPFTGGAAAPAAAAAGARSASTLGQLAARYGRNIGAGAATGAVTGAGVADEGDRLGEAGVGAIIGGGVGAALPAAVQGGRAAVNFASSRLSDAEPIIDRFAAERINAALARTGMTPAEAGDVVAADRARGIPSTLANVDPKMAAALERVAPRSEATERRVVEALEPQVEGSRYRGTVQVQQRLGAGNLFDDEEAITRDLRTRADQNYRAAYATGDVNDAAIAQIINEPAVQNAYRDAAQIASADAQAARTNAARFGTPFSPDDYAIRPPGQTPDVRTIDYLKRALDGRVSSLYAARESTSNAEANSIKIIRNNLRDRTKEVVPEYREALNRYAGDVEVRDALRNGFENFNKLNREEIERLFNRPPSAGGFSDAEKDAFVTGVNRYLYARIMQPSDITSRGTASNLNTVGNLINSPEMAKKLRPLFDSDSHFDMFRAALEREGQLFEQGSRVLQSAVRGGAMRAAGDIDENSAVGQALAQAMSGNFRQTLTNFAASAARNSTLNEKMADRIAQMLLSSKPDEVAAAVRVLEDYAEKAASRSRGQQIRETGAVVATQPALITREFPQEEEQRR
jgi:hypothetical protein